MAIAQVAIASRPKPGQMECGDVATVWTHGSDTICCVADGVGHGPPARAAAVEAVRFFESNWGIPLDRLFTEANQALCETRGLALSVAVIDPAAERLRYGGIGNIGCLHLRFGGQRVRLHSTPGILGINYAPVILREDPFRLGDTLLLYTDGLTDRIHLLPQDTPGAGYLQAHTESLLSEYAGDRDDALILVAT
ncbi:MAG: SpoIIE family protein phosphatase [Phycisphaerae bacterium]